MESGSDQSNHLPTCRVWASVVCSERDWRKYLTRVQMTRVSAATFPRGALDPVDRRPLRAPALLPDGRPSYPRGALFAVRQTTGQTQTPAPASDW
jgi:hypothetical protein